MTNWHFHEHLAHERHESFLREARQARLAAEARGAAPEPMRRVRGARIAALVPRLRRTALREV